MRIAMLHWAALPTAGGIEVHLETLVAGLRANGETVTFLAGTPHAETATFHPALRPGGHLTDEHLRDLVGIVSGHDVLHVHNPQWHRPEVIDALLTSLDQRGWAGARVFSVHNLADDPGHESLLRRLPSPLVAHSTFVAGVLRAVVPGSQVRILPLALPVEDAEVDIEANVVTPRPPVILQPTRLSAWKGSHLSLTAALDLLDAGRRFVFVHAGTEHLLWGHGLTDDLLARMAPWHERGMVSFVHYPPGRSWAAIRAADLIVHPTTGVGTHGEPYSMSVAQAMLAGRPVVVSRSGNLPDLVDGYPCARVVEAGDLDGLRTAMDSFLAGEWPDTPDPERVTSALRAWHASAIDHHLALYRTRVGAAAGRTGRECGVLDDHRARR